MPMKIYFFSKNNLDNAEQKAAHDSIIKFFSDNGATVFSNLLERSEKQESLSLDYMNGLIIEGTGSVNESGYLIAQFLAQNKPILYLLPKSAELPGQLQPLLHSEKLKKLFLLKYYTPRLLQNFLIDYLDIIEMGELRRETPNVKFTLRFTPRVDRYLLWKSKKIQMAKADFIRKLIDNALLADEEYQKQLRKLHEITNLNQSEK